jgi:hypothetical protein
MMVSLILFSCATAVLGSGATDVFDTDDGPVYAPDAPWPRAHFQACTLTGMWAGVGDVGTYAIHQSGSELSGTYQPVSAIPSMFSKHWSTFTGTINVSTWPSDRAHGVAEYAPALAMPARADSLHAMFSSI